MRHFDVIIVGAGPVGLSLAKTLSMNDLTVLLIEQQDEASITAPKFDGREIALTHASKQFMEKLGFWNQIPSDAISPMLDARVFNGTSLFALKIDHDDVAKEALGFLVSNHLIRRAAYEIVKQDARVKLLTESKVAKVKIQPSYVSVMLEGGECIEAQLLVAADSRFSETRRAMGISADMHDFGKTMMVCQMQHEKSHQHSAWEWFDYGQTLALLPMNGQQSSVVLTLSAMEMNDLMHMPEEQFNQAITKRFKNRLGKMQLVSTRHAYPLVTAYAKRMISERFVLVGDAAVGMHPVTAHGFNFGLKSIDSLMQAISWAKQHHLDIAAPQALQSYEQQHRKNTRPLFLATHAIAKLYNDDRLPARIIRTGALRLSHFVKPFKRQLAGFLSEPHNTQGLT
ncbi:MAG: 5-demethoxyubiquinol-8 5-hydroxylase UbiM [Methylophilus sp.]|nr:5-demethoxyubiquinol-8 5-hydroxylase UbiM [Methylophilus sp.]